MIKYIDCEVGGKLYKNVEFKSLGFHFNNIKWNLLDKITWPFYRLRRILKDAKWSIKYAFERVKDGYDSRDVFSLDYNFIWRYENILKDFRKYNNGFPCSMTEEAWNKIIDNMLYHLHYMYENNVEDELQAYVKDEKDSYIVVGTTIYDIMKEHKDEFFKLFSEYFYSLWY